MRTLGRQAFLVLLLLAFAPGASVAPQDPPDVTWPRMGEIVGADGAPMILVPAGEFVMGSDESDPWASYWEKPQHRVTLGAFFIDKYEVPLGQYLRFLESVKKEGHRHCDPTEPRERDHTPIGGQGVRWSEPQLPVELVGWWEAAAYCAWAGERLPTEAEWEKAARGTDGRLYPWGNSLPGTAPYGNFWDEASYRRPREGTSQVQNPGNFIKGYDDRYRSAAPIGSFPNGVSPWGAEDMAGNVAEWVADRYEEEYYHVSPLVNPKGPEAGPWRVFRGGSYFSAAGTLRAAARARGGEGWRSEGLGFRCARDKN